MSPLRYDLQQAAAARVCLLRADHPGYLSVDEFYLGAYVEVGRVAWGLRNVVAGFMCEMNVSRQLPMKRRFDFPSLEMRRARDFLVRFLRPL